MLEEYKLQGLSCANCAREMEGEIQKLTNGEGAKILFNSSKLIVPEKIELTRVEKILATDGAKIIKTDDHASEHTHSHSNAKKMITLVIISSLVFIAAIFIEKVSMPIAIASYVGAAALSGYTTFIKGLKNIIRFKFNIDTLMTIALIGAFSIGEWKEGTLVAILFGINEFLEGIGMEKARKSMETLLKVAPKEAIVIRHNQEQIIPIAELLVDDLVLVKSGEKIPSDGIVMEGESSVNEAAITGESMPVNKLSGEAVFGGSINNEGVLKVRITKAYEDSSLARILHLVEEAQETKTPTEQFINRFAKYYTPLVLVIALIVMFIPPLFTGDWGAWFYQGLAVLIVGCPCALIISSPIAIVSGIARNARNGILVKGGVHLEQLGKIDTIAFDKTGTLTIGEPHVEEWMEYDEKFMEIAAAIERSSSHPLAKAIVKKAEEYPIHRIEADKVETITGQGMVAEVAGMEYYLGNEKSIPQTAITDDVQATIQKLKDAGHTLVILSTVEKVYGIFGVSDEIREESQQVVTELQHVGIKNVVMLTGDHEKTAEKVANRIGLTNYYANLLPHMKVEKIKELQAHSHIAMIGDGINDAPALATANIGIAMGKGTDSAIETADVVLMQDHLGKLPTAVNIAKRVNSLIKLNISIALGLKIIALLLTIPGWLTLWFAILSDMGATILVTLISLTILIEKRKN